MQTRRSSGFTLIEIAIVLVIIGLLLGGVLAGQQLIRSARVRNLIAQQEGLKAAFFGFQDRYRALPGDYASADTNIGCDSGTCLNGNGNGQVQRNATPVAGSQVHEEILVWAHLSAAGFLNGSYTMQTGAAAPTPTNTPQNPYGAYIQIAYDDLWGSSDHLGTNLRHSVKTGNQAPVQIMAEVDRKIDDGFPYSGSFQFSTFNGTGGNAPDVGGAFGNSCADSDGDPPAQRAIWNEPQGQDNCGGASLL